VRILGSACGLAIEGSGWVIAPDEVLTNAHVVAGETDTTVEAYGAPPSLPATVVLFDAYNDLAVLRVPDLGLPTLSLARQSPTGTAAAILGYPENGPFVAEPGRIGMTRRVLTENAYGRGPVTRQLTLVRGLVRPGNSGGPAVDANGQVVATIFAATTSAGPRGGFGVPDSVTRQDLERARGPVSTEGCAG
jgi:S1-C subfamily serine protease